MFDEGTSSRKLPRNWGGADPPLGRSPEGTRSDSVPSPFRQAFVTGRKALDRWTVTHNVHPPMPCNHVFAILLVAALDREERPRTRRFDFPLMSLAPPPPSSVLDRERVRGERRGASTSPATWYTVRGAARHVNHLLLNLNVENCAVVEEVWPFKGSCFATGRWPRVEAREPSPRSRNSSGSGSFPRRKGELAREPSLNPPIRESWCSCAWKMLEARTVRCGSPSDGYAPSSRPPAPPGPAPPRRRDPSEHELSASITATLL